MYALTKFRQAQAQQKLSGSTFLERLAIRKPCDLFLEVDNKIYSNSEFERFCRLGDSLRRDAHVPAKTPVNAFFGSTEYETFVSVSTSFL